MEELKRCPFCGGETVIRYTKGNPNGWTSNIFYPEEMALVECCKCHAKSGKMKAKNAVKSWNRRVENG